MQVCEVHGMNCQDFELFLTDVARGATVPAPELSAVENHRAHCEQCDRFLSGSRALTEILAATTALDEMKHPSGAMEFELLKAFRSNAEPAVVRWPVRWNPRILAMAAAIALLIAGAILAAMTVYSRKDAAPQQAKTIPPPSVAPQKIPVNPPTLTGQMEQRLPDKVALNRTTHSLRAVSRAQHNRVAAGGASSSQLDSTQPRLPAKEIATDFFAVNPTGLWQPMDGGALVRVQLPPSALSRYGLPITFDPGAKLVKADVLVGEDGFPRAIRFVR